MFSAAQFSALCLGSLFFLSAAPSLAHPPVSHMARANNFHRCGTADDRNKPGHKEAQRRVTDYLARMSETERVSMKLSVIEIPVVLHVVQDESAKGKKDPKAGYISHVQAHKQIDVLNADYKSAGFQFRLEKVHRVWNATQFQSVGPLTDSQAELKASVREGDAATLNLYTVSFSESEGLLGYSTFPWLYNSAKSDDGVVINWQTLPDGAAEHYNMGRTATHEIGHWLGLYHPFQGACGKENDHVDDTPAEKDPVSGCPKAKKLCNGKTSKLAASNFMDYAFDSCMNQFTAGQIQRARAQFNIFRLGNGTDSGAPSA